MKRTKRSALLALGLGVLLLAAACTETDNVTNPGPDPLAGQNMVKFVLEPSGGAGVAASTSEFVAPRLTDSAGTIALGHDDDDDGDGNGGGERGELQEANITFATIAARNLEGVLVNVNIELPTTVNILELRNGPIELPDGFLPDGTYDQVVVVMTVVELVFERKDGTVIKIEVTPPGGGWTAVIPIRPPVTVGEDENGENGENGGEPPEISLRFKFRECFDQVNGRWRFNHCSAFDCRD